MPLRLHTCSAPPELPRSISPRLHAYSTPPELQNSILLYPASIPPYLRVPKPTARLPSSRSPYIYTPTSPGPEYTSRPPDLYTFTSPRPQHASRVPEPQHLHVYTPADRLQSSIPLCLLHVPAPAACLPSSRSLEANTSMSPAAAAWLMSITWMEGRDGTRRELREIQENLKGGELERRERDMVS